ncbi:hypothetical protein L6E24_13170 [Methanoplanus endosymbiosus]|uniref:Uncharacterized protein n=1 Tax=Methanoplanus endosymbiosus TaxID=33865 RepID=A0A9E7TID5_9EURY|nr:hypothetical protein L6E24_13170 [Methanoplanus endosymbiosus]
MGDGGHIFKDVTLGFPSRENLENLRKSGKEDFTGVTIGNNFVLRPGTIIYSDVTIGDNF